jgi:hypothetical protein
LPGVRNTARGEGDHLAATWRRLGRLVGRRVGKAPADQGAALAAAATFEIGAATYEPGRDLSEGRADREDADQDDGRDQADPPALSVAAGDFQEDVGSEGVA